ncbi:MAG: hypothetical protein FJX59_05425 [Alphaproteobacteria bacterium]|nr:hypothetical protein [Alphaproteobacteria bacterium]
MTKLFPANVEARKRKALRPEDIDRLGAAIWTLTKELWVVKDRQAVTEAVLKARGIDITADIDRYQPDPEVEKHLAAERQALVRKITEELTGDYAPMM